MAQDTLSSVAEGAGFEPARHLSAPTRFPVALLRPTRTPLRRGNLVYLVEGGRSRKRGGEAGPARRSLAKAGGTLLACRLTDGSNTGLFIGRQDPRSLPRHLSVSDYTILGRLRAARLAELRTRRRRARRFARSCRPKRFPPPTRSAKSGRRFPSNASLDYRGLELYDRQGRVHTVLVPPPKPALGADAWEPQSPRR